MITEILAAIKKKKITPATEMIRGRSNWLEGFIFAVSEEHSLSVIRKRCEKHGFKMLKNKV